MTTHTQTYNNYPLADCIKKAQTLVRRGGIRIHQKFSCANCMQRLTIDEPNMFCTHGTCDKCGHITNIVETGCNYLLHASTQFPPSDITVCVTYHTPIPGLI